MVAKLRNTFPSLPCSLVCVVILKHAATSRYASPKKVTTTAREYGPARMAVVEVILNGL